MRGNATRQLVQRQRKALENKRSKEGRLRKEQRKAKGRALEIVKAIRNSPAGRKAAEAGKAERVEALAKEQQHYQKAKARIATRMGGRRKQIQAELHAGIE